jgi:hypothetical protein
MKLEAVLLGLRRRLRRVESNCIRVWKDRCRRNGEGGGLADKDWPWAVRGFGRVFVWKRVAHIVPYARTLLLECHFSGPAHDGDAQLSCLGLSLKIYACPLWPSWFAQQSNGVRAFSVLRSQIGWHLVHIVLRWGPDCSMSNVVKTFRLAWRTPSAELCQYCDDGFVVFWSSTWRFLSRYITLEQVRWHSRYEDVDHSSSARSSPRFAWSFRRARAARIPCIFGRDAERPGAR